MAKTAKISPLAEGAALLDLYYTTRQRRLDLAKQVAEVEKEEKALKQQVIDLLVLHNATAIGGRHARAERVVKYRAEAADWASIQQYIITTGDWAVLQRRLLDSHLKELAEDGQQVPGIQWVEFDDLSISKAK